MKLVIKNGHVMDPASGRDEVTDIWMEDKKIIGFGEHPEWEEDAEKLNADAVLRHQDLLMCMYIFVIRVLRIKKIWKPEVMQQQQEDSQRLSVWQIQNQSLILQK